MSNTVNLTRIASKSLAGGHAPLPGSGESAKKEADKFRPLTEHTAVKRTIPVTDPAPVVEEEAEPAADAAQPAEGAAVEETRHAKWKAAQEAKRAARAQQKIDGEAKRQMLAKDLLGKGDIAAAAKALGMPPSELVTLVNNAALGMKPEAEVAKPLTPEEQRAADEKTFREEMHAFRKEQEDWRSQQAMTSFIGENIRPVLADKDAYEMIHAKGVADIETYAYRYMNQHYFDTSEKDANGKITKPGEILSAKDVLDAIEGELVRVQSAAIEASRPLKKLSKFFAPVPVEGEAEPVASSEVAGSTALSSGRRALIAAALAEQEAEQGAGAPAELGAEVEERETPPAADPVRPKVVRPADGNVRAPKMLGGKLTAAEKIARARAEEAEEARKLLFKGGRR